MEEQRQRQEAEARRAQPSEGKVEGAVPAAIKEGKLP